MGVISNNFRQEITWWRMCINEDGEIEPKTDSEGNYYSPEIIWGRWLEKHELFRFFATADLVTSKAIIYLNIEPKLKSMDVGDFLFLGTSTATGLIDNPLPTGSHSADRAYQIKLISTEPDLRNLNNLSKVWL